MHYSHNHKIIYFEIHTLYVTGNFSDSINIDIIRLVWTLGEVNPLLLCVLHICTFNINSYQDKKITLATDA